MRALAAFVLILLVAPVAAAQHEHMGSEGMAMALHDGPDDGRAVVGALTHFGFALLDAQGAPVVHQNAQFRVTLDNETFFATNDTHEYDGLFSLDVVFPHAGHYAVLASSGKMANGTFEGDAVDAVNETVAKAVFTSQPDGAAGVVGKLDVQGPDGKTIPHTDAILEWRSGAGALVARYHAHIHTEPIAFTQGFDAPGDYALHVTAYKAFGTGRTTDVRAVVADFHVTAGAVAAPSLPDPAALPPAPLEPAGMKATSGDLTLYGMYDPQNQVEMGFPMRLSGLVEGKDGMPMPHVDFQLDVHGPRGTIFSSKTLHEYDGHFEWLYVPTVPGAYDAVLTATEGKAKVSVPFHVQVIPPVVPASVPSGGGAGPATISIAGLDKAQAGVPVELTFSAMGPTGPIQHSEVDVTLVQPGHAAAYNFKLHTHDSGLSKAVVVFPESGDWIVRVDPLPTDMPPVAFQGPDGPGAPVVFHAKVGAGSMAAVLASAPNGGAPKTVPGIGLSAVCLVGFALAFAVRRRR